ncbi:MAG TPA: SDR family NAD(P)-dependent oxidoreductase [Deltaproteobacteria bacterium]|nr:SDR family NAD(P)-dependent oxidoreductase [Deltaproteobacteria bacterium]
MKKAVIIGVGAEQGLGAQLAKRFASEGLHVFVASRTQSRIDALTVEIEQAGGIATAVCADATNEEQVIKLFEKAGSGLRLAIYNTGNNFPGQIIDMESDYFEKSWKSCCFGGFLFGREAVRRMVPSGNGTLLFTGASASLRGRANFGAFNSAKAGLRTLAQAMAKEYGPRGIHVGHVVIDGAIAGDKIMRHLPELAKKLGEDGMIKIEGIVDGYEYLYNQSPQAWTFELDLRTYIEKW